jgi:DNA mismatch repair protein MutS
MFATHYHELTELSRRLPGVANLSVAVKEEGENIVFLRSLVKGGADRSYGVEVARLAGLPTEVTARARELLLELEAGARTPGARLPAPRSAPDADQLGLFPAGPHPVVQRLRSLDPDHLTPIQALGILAELRAEAVK